MKVIDKLNFFLKDSFYYFAQRGGKGTANKYPDYAHNTGLATLKL